MESMSVGSAKPMSCVEPKSVIFAFVPGESDLNAARIATVVPTVLNAELIVYSCPLTNVKILDAVNVVMVSVPMVTPKAPAKVHATLPKVRVVTRSADKIVSVAAAVNFTPGNVTPLVSNVAEPATPMLPLPAIVPAT